MENPMHQLKTILLNQYIGAIAIGYLFGRGTEAFLGGLMPTVDELLTEIMTRHRFVGSSAWSQARISLISNIFLSGLYYAFAYFVASWLYSKPNTDQRD
jgi:uncharacterized membrane protein